MDMKDLVDRITRDVVENIKQQHGSSPTQAAVKTVGGKVLLIVEDFLSAAQWDSLLGGCMKGAQVSLLNLSPSSPVAASCITETIFSAENLHGRVGGFEKVIYVASSLYQLSAIANLMDNFKGVRAFFDNASSSCGPVLINFVNKPFFSSQISKLISLISSMGISVDGSAVSACAPQSSSKGGCDIESGECSGCGKCPSLAAKRVDAVVSAGAQRISAGPGNAVVDKALAAQIDHTLLKADATKEEVVKLCQEAREYVFASVCVNPGHVKLAADCLNGSPVKVCTVIGFPLGATTSVTKAMETRDAIANGASEIDMVINVGALKAGNYELVQRDIEAVVQAAAGNLVKVILETALLTDEEKVVACKLSQKAGADFVKTSTGFGPGGATAKDIALMRETVGSYMGVKASGGIRDLSTAQEMIKAGATRIGASASVSIVKGEQGKSAY